MGRLEVQGIVSASTGEPFVQFRQLDDGGDVQAMWQASPAQAREMAQQVQEAATNAVYDAAIALWARETWPNDPMVGANMLRIIREHRADSWGLPDQPDDWNVR